VSNNESQRTDIDQVVVRPYPKVVLLYPTALCALVCAVVQALSSEGAGAQNTGSTTLGLIFFTVFALNLLVFSFEFSRIQTLTLLFALLAAVFLCLWLAQKWPIIDTLRNFVKNRVLYMSTEMYWALVIYFMVIFIGVFINTRFNYYEIRHNEILHHTGFLGQVRRFPSPNLKLTKEINDVFEYLLLRSGRLILFPATEREAIVLENVPFVNSAERSILELLGTLQVEVESTSPPRQEGVE